MNYINNWATQLSAPMLADDTVIAIPLGASSLLDLSGVYWLTITDVDRARWEIVEVSSGLSVMRGKDGTTAQEWAAGSHVYCAVTAGQLAGMMSRIEALESAANPTGDALTDGMGSALTDFDNNILTAV